MNHPALSLTTPSLSQYLGQESSIGRILLEMGKLTPENAEQVLRVQKERGLRFGEAAEYLGLVTPEDIQQVLSRQFEYPYLQKSEGKYPIELVAAYQPFTPAVETLRAVRSQLMLRWFTQGHRALALAAIDADNEASLFAANLAVVFSQLGEHTLLVDSNLRKPSQKKIFALENNQGLSDMLAGRVGMEIVHKIDSFVDLSILAAGTLPPNPQELVSRASFNEVNVRLTGHYDVVLYDVPAFSEGADAMAISAKIGGVVLIIRKNKTRIAAISEICKQLSGNNVQVVGSVMVD